MDAKIQSCASSVVAELYTPRDLKRAGAAIHPRVRGLTSTPLNCSEDSINLASGHWSQLISVPALAASSVLQLGDPKAYHCHLVSQIGKLRHSPCASMGEYPVHSCLGYKPMFQQNPGSLKRKTCKASHPGTLPAACPSDMGKRRPPGTGCQGGTLREP